MSKETEFARRLEMITAVKNDDYAALNTLLRADTGLDSFYQLMTGIVSRGETETAKKCLALPSLHKTTPLFELLIRSLTYTAANNNGKELVELLLTHARDPKNIAQIALTSMFNSVAADPNIVLNVEIGKVLVANGADIFTAAEFQEGIAQMEKRLAADKLTKIQQFKTNLKRP
jgi:hypothetical protein